MSKYHDHRSDCPFKFAPLDVCDCVEHNMLDHIEQLVVTNKSLIKELNTCRMAQAVMDNTVADLEGKLAGGVIAEYDDDSTVFLSGYAGGAAIGGAWSTLTLMEKASDGTLRVREYKAQGDWRDTLAEIKGESHD